LSALGCLARIALLRPSVLNFIEIQKHNFKGDKLMSKMRPLHDRIILKREPEEQKTTGGIIIPGTAQEKPQMAVVVALGHGKKLDNGDFVKIALKVGDRVLLGKYSGSEVKIDGDEHVIVREEDILGVFEK